MSAVSAIGLKLCPMATKDCSKGYNGTTRMFAYPTPAYQRLLDDRKTEPDFQVNVYVSATIHHNNITINSDKAINIDMKSVNNFTSSSTDQHNVFQKFFPSHFEFLRDLMNKSADAGVLNGSIEELPKNEFFKSEIPSNFSDTGGISVDDDNYTDPCSHPEYIVFTWVRNSSIFKLQQKY